MLLILMRHGIAEPREVWDGDWTRPLSSEGRDRTFRAAQGLTRLLPHFDTLISSPKTRARQTAQIVRDVLGKNAPPLVEWPEIAEETTESWPQKLRATKTADETVDERALLLVGHEPTLSQFVARTLCGDENGLCLDFKKAGVCALDYDPHSARATLLWLATPKMLRKLAP